MFRIFGIVSLQCARQLIHMLDQNTNRRFLVDTGASYNILSQHSSLPATSHKLFGQAGQPIISYRENAWWGSKNRIFLGNFVKPKYVLSPFHGCGFSETSHKLLTDPCGNAWHGPSPTRPHPTAVLSNHLRRAPLRRLGVTFPRYRPSPQGRPAPEQLPLRPTPSNQLAK